MEKITNKVSKLNIQIKKPIEKPVAKKRIIENEDDISSEQQSESETSSLEKFSTKINSLKLQSPKKVKINPFAGV